jgi:hypothetical protein
VNRWLTWRARLEHLFNPANECLCHVCAQARIRIDERAARLKLQSALVEAMMLRNPNVRRS